MNLKYIYSAFVYFVSLPVLLIAFWKLCISINFNFEGLFGTGPSSPYIFFAPFILLVSMALWLYVSYLIFKWVRIAIDFMRHIKTNDRDSRYGGNISYLGYHSQSFSLKLTVVWVVIIIYMFPSLQDKLLSLGELLQKL